MSFGETFGQLVKRQRGIEGLTQQELAVKAFGDESFKTRISELENGRVKNPQAKTVDPLCVALNISDEELSRILNLEPSPHVVDNLTDFFSLLPPNRLDIEVATSDDGRVVLFHNWPLKVTIKRAEFFVDEQMFVCLTEGGRRRPAGLPLGKDVSQYIQLCKEILFVHLPIDGGEPIAGETYPLKIIK